MFLGNGHLHDFDEDTENIDLGECITVHVVGKIATDMGKDFYQGLQNEAYNSEGS